jgi:hypothetical protein
VSTRRRVRPPDNPLALSTDADARRIITYGLRNPCRINVRRGANDVWAGYVGWSTWGEINRGVDPGSLENFGWSCYAGEQRSRATTAPPERVR